MYGIVMARTRFSNTHTRGQGKLNMPFPPFYGVGIKAIKHNNLDIRIGVNQGQAVRLKTVLLLSLCS